MLSGMIPADLARGTAADGYARPLVAGAAGPGEVRVVRLFLDLPLPPEAGEILSIAERERAARFRSEVHRRRFVAAHVGLRQVLGRCLGRDPADLEFDHSDRGRPSVRRTAPAAFDFNLAHSGEVALIALSGRTVGVDVEDVREIRDLLAIAGRFFSPREVATLTGLAGEARRRGFFTAWTRKEAVIKAVGAGLAALEQTEVSLAPDTDPVVLAAPGGAEAWQLFHLEPCPGYVGALAVRTATTPVRLTTWSWRP